MITIDDCISISDCTHDEVEAVAEHAGLPMMAAAGMAQFLASQKHGESIIKHIVGSVEKSR